MITNTKPDRAADALFATLWQVTSEYDTLVSAWVNGDIDDRYFHRREAVLSRRIAALNAKLVERGLA